MARNTTFWNQLLMRSDSITDIDARAPDARDQIIAQLATISEQFDRTFDPADQFEEYVAVAFCQALQRALAPPRATAVCKMIPKREPAAAPRVNSEAKKPAAAAPKSVSAKPTAKKTKSAARSRDKTTGLSTGKAPKRP